MLLGSGIGWTFRDRVARQARVSEQIELILDEVGRLEQEQKWTEALAAAKRASAVLASGEAAADLQEKFPEMLYPGVGTINGHGEFCGRVASPGQTTVAVSL